MNAAQVESALQALVNSYDTESLPYDLLLAYGQPKSSVTRLQKGTLNLSRIAGEIVWKKKLYYKAVSTPELASVFAAMQNAKPVTAHNPRFVIACDGKTLLAQDTKTGDKLDVAIKELPRNYDFFLPWAGMEKAQVQSENPADVKAAERMAKLYDEIRKDNPHSTEAQVHDLNVFLSRLLFCFFAEDTDIFKEGQFSSAIASHTQPDGSDVAQYLDTLFEVLNKPENGRKKGLPHYLAAFPYVNGGLFRVPHAAPNFSRKSRQMLIDSGELNWAEIHPDIFGSMIQAVVTPEHRGGLGMHYTSVPNIMKVIEPLFLDDLNAELTAALNSPAKLNKLLERLANIKVFDPACGSGNFLIIAYKELRLFEIKILKRLKEIGQMATGPTGFEDKGQLSMIPKTQQTLAVAATQAALFSRIELSQFYGIELDDFAHEIAILSLWLAEHQMNLRFKRETGGGGTTLPLKAGGNVVPGNATRLDWETVCPKEPAGEVFILGNPPYLGYSIQSVAQKKDMAVTFAKVSKYKNLDYIACWFEKGADYILGANASFAFVSTNSICQGEQAVTLWPHIFDKKLEIHFAHQSFKWSNNAKAKAAVVCVIVGVRNATNAPKKIFASDLVQNTHNINAYLADAPNIQLQKRSAPLSGIQPILRGSGPVDGGNLIMNNGEKRELVKKTPDAAKFLKQFLGSEELINGNERWCIWLEPGDLKEAKRIPEIKSRIEKVKAFRLASSKKATREAANTPFAFAEDRFREGELLVVPSTSSERREYIPIGIFPTETVISNSAQAIYSPQTHTFGIISSKMHMAWVRAVCGSLETRIRYSSALGYNTFPFPPITEKQKARIEQLVLGIIEQRELNSEKTLAQLYDPEKMPAGLRAAHHALDLAIDSCYRSKPFASDEERLEVLFALYEKMIAEERSAGELFAEPKAKKGRKAAR